jgi:hypothetical protein
MTWEEMGRKYEQDLKQLKTERKVPKLDKNWNELVRSTDKLIWLFSLSNGNRGKAKAD